MPETEDKTCQQITIPSTTQPFLRNFFIRRHHRPESSHTPSTFSSNTQSFLRPLLPLWAGHLQQPYSLIFHLQFYKWDSLISWSRLSRHIISHFEHCKPLLQRRQLQMATEITLNNQEHNPNSYEEISTCKSCYYRD